MKTYKVSQFKARCLGLLKEVRDGGEPIVVTLRGRTLAVVHPQGACASDGSETVADTLARLRPLLLLEEEEFEAPVRTDRPSAQDSFPEDESCAT